MFGDLDWTLNASRGLSAIAEFLVVFHLQYSNTSKLGCRTSRWSQLNSLVGFAAKWHDHALRVGRENLAT